MRLQTIILINSLRKIVLNCLNNLHIFQYCVCTFTLRRIFGVTILKYVVIHKSISWIAIDYCICIESSKSEFKKISR